MRLFIFVLFFLIPIGAKATGCGFTEEVTGFYAEKYRDKIHVDSIQRDGSLRVTVYFPEKLDSQLFREAVIKGKYIPDGSSQLHLTIPVMVEDEDSGKSFFIEIDDKIKNDVYILLWYQSTTNCGIELDYKLTSLVSS